ncbi:lipocalin family protein [Caulobacter sp. UNC279MFTsu5.1]|uniref:lipocalin family protein n=1 Tax=Caulobacter sp. UNC279MFTsu5.1 TaxID=1502775 RepID=UPI0003747E87|nr:lipocalin family protein [Caulobacter sp. UNC279MFTsu5.1]SFK45346.1 apolipoprotein D and lipocalin family protein [Caulobacter sp. UNC279MFTsu5.1]
MRRLKILIAAGLLATPMLSTQALAAAKPPARPIAASFYTGKWYEIARTPNAGQRDCEAPTTEFTGKGGDGFSVHQVCRKGSAGGAAKAFDTTGRIIANSQNTRFTMSFLGGLKKQEYWVLDCADDHSWAIMATPGGNFVWLLSRKAVMDPTAKARALERVKILGYAKLEYPQQPPA